MKKRLAVAGFNLSNGSISFQTKVWIWLGRVFKIFFALLVTFHLSLITDVYGAIPPQINYQGRLTDASGTPVTGQLPFVFRIYDSVPTLLWSETQNGINVTNGVFDVQIGTMSGIPTSMFENPDRWLEIVVNGQALSPKIKLISTPYSFVSEKSYGVIGTTITSTNIVNNAITPILVSTASFEHIRVGTATYSINAGTSSWATNSALFNGYNSGNASGNIPISNGIVNTNLNADLLDGKDYTAFLSTSGGTISGGLTINNGLTVNNAVINPQAGISMTGQTIYGAFNINGNAPGSNRLNLSASASGSANEGAYITLYSSYSGSGSIDLVYGSQGAPTDSKVKFIYYNGTSWTNTMSISTAGILVIKGSLTQNGSPDVAENIYFTAPINDGDIVVVDPNNDEHIIQSNVPYQSSVLGVVVDNPGMLLNSKDAIDTGNRRRPNEKSLVLVGRVYVNVCDENGPIQRGDLLVTSSKPGYAMKSIPEIINGKPFYPSGCIVGKALQSLTSGSGKILAMINLQ